MGANNARSTLDLGAAWIFLCGLVASIWTTQSSGRDTAMTIMAVCVVPVMLIHAFRARIAGLYRAFCRRRRAPEAASARKLKTSSGVAIPEADKGVGAAAGAADAAGSGPTIGSAPSTQTPDAKPGPDSNTSAPGRTTTAPEPA